MSIIDLSIKEPLEEVIYFLTERMMRQSREYTYKVFRENGIKLTIDQFILLKKITETPHISQIGLAEATFRDPASITRTLELLYKKGYIIKSRNPENKKENLLTLTKIGQTKMKSILPYVLDIRKKGMGGLSHQELETVKSVMRKMHSNFI